MSLEIVAEPGCTAESDFDRYMALIDAAAEAGASCFKNQYVSNPAKLCERRSAHDYLVPYGWLAYPLFWHREFAARCRALGMEYACSTVLPEDVGLLRRLVDGDREVIDWLKVPSFEAMKRDMWDAHEDALGRLVISTGMCNQAEVKALDSWRRRGHNIHRRVDLLHCVSAYPAPREDMNLRVIRHAWCDGFSDHSREVLTGARAVQQGARILEVHVRLDECDPNNPDFGTALTFKEFAEYVAAARNPDSVPEDEALLGDGVKRPMKSEDEMAKYRVT